jgi:hypothetical protein
MTEVYPEPEWIPAFLYGVALTLDELEDIKRRFMERRRPK